MVLMCPLLGSMEEKELTMKTAKAANVVTHRQTVGTSCNFHKKYSFSPS